MDTRNKARCPKPYQDMTPAEQFEDRITWKEGDIEIPYDPRQDPAKHEPPIPFAPPKFRKH